jgi:hypothetical protein
MNYTVWQWAGPMGGAAVLPRARRCAGRMALPLALLVLPLAGHAAWAAGQDAAGAPLGAPSSGLTIPRIIHTYFMNGDEVLAAVRGGPAGDVRQRRRPGHTASLQQPCMMVCAQML